MNGTCSSSSLLRSEITFAPSRQKDSECSSAGSTSSYARCAGEVTMKERQEQGEEGGGGMEWSIKRDLLKRHQASLGGGEELHPRPSHLFSRRTEREKQRERETGGEWRLGEDGRDGEGAAIQHIDLMSVLALFQKWSWEDDGNIYTQCTTRLDSRSLHSQVFSH